MVLLFISNLIATGRLAENVNLDLVGRLDHASFNSKIYPCAYLKTASMHSKVSVFSSGKMISVGTKSEEDAKQDLQDTATYLAKEKILTKKPTDLAFMVQNMVFVGELEVRYDLNRLYDMLGNAIFEPEQFPGVIHHPPQHPHVSILFFQSGKCVIAGIRNSNDLDRIRKYLEEIEERLR